MDFTAILAEVDKLREDIVAASTPVPAPEPTPVATVVSVTVTWSDGTTAEFDPKV